MVRTCSRVLCLAGLMAGLVLGQSASADEPVRVKGSEQQAKLVKKIIPVYPAEAKAAGIQGTVLLEVVIAKDGTAKETTVLRGPAELAPAATEAVSQWKWQPTKINGQPVEVITQVQVNYRLDGNKQ